MKNPIDRLLSAFGGKPAPAAPAPRPALPPAPPSPPPLEVRRAEAAVSDAARAEHEAQSAHAAALQAHEDAARNLEKAEDTAASSSDDESAAALLASQQIEARAAGVLRSSARRLENARAALAAARARLEGARADADRAEAEARIVKATEDAEKAASTYTATHPGPKLAALFDMTKKAFGEARGRAGIVRADIVAALEAAEAADKRALAAEPHRAEDIAAEAEERRAAARAALESLADVERWYSHAAPAIALISLAGELEREARGILAELAAEAHAAGVDAGKVGSEFEPLNSKLCEAAVLLGQFLGKTPEERADIERLSWSIDTMIMRALSTQWSASDRLHEGNRGRALSSEERARLVLRDPLGKARVMLRADHARLVEKGERMALEYEERQGRGTDPRLDALRAEDERKAAEARARAHGRGGRGVFVSN